MKLIVKFALATLLALSAAINAKDASSDVESLNKALAKYEALQKANKMDESVEMVHPALFEVVPKEQVLAAMKQTQQGMEIPPTVHGFNQVPTLPLKTYDKGLYTTVEYTVDMSMDMMQPKDDKEKMAGMQKMLENPDEFKKFQEFMKQMFTMSMGEGTEVNFKDNSFNVNIKRKGAYLAINEGGKGWKFIDGVPVQLPQLKTVLPAEMMKDLEAAMAKK